MTHDTRALLPPVDFMPRPIIIGRVRPGEIVRALDGHLFLMGPNGSETPIPANQSRARAQKPPRELPSRGGGTSARGRGATPRIKSKKHRGKT